MRSISLESGRALDEIETAEPGPLASVTPLRIGARAPGADWEALSMECEAQTAYGVQFCDSLLGPGSTAVEEAVGDRRAILVTTPTVDRLWGAGMRAALAKTDTVAYLVLDVREETKSIDLVEKVCAAALSHGLSRRGLLIAFGGGVCSDIVTMAASLTRRGIAHLRVPTTLIGQIDAGIGLKGAVNFCGRKSFLGCYHPAERVLIDPSFLTSLPRKFLVAGIAEAVKMGVVRDASLFEMLERWAPALVRTGFDEPRAEGREVLRRSIWAMFEELRQNPYEDQTYERLVDFGHTFSPALESALAFGIQHGEAVAIDIALSSAIARTLGIIPADLCERILGALRGASLPIFAPRLDLKLCREGLVEAARHRGGTMNLVVPAGIGRAVFLKQQADVPDGVLADSLASLAGSAEEAA